MLYFQCLLYTLGLQLTSRIFNTGSETYFTEAPTGGVL